MSSGINKITGNDVSRFTRQTNTAQSMQKSASTNINNYIKEENSKVNNSRRIPTANELKKIINKINENVSRLNKEVKFSYNDTLKSLVVKVIDVKTGKVIREIPPQEVINLQKKLSEVVGIIFDSKEVER